MRTQGQLLKLRSHVMSPQAQQTLLRRTTLVAAVSALGLCLSLASFDISRQNQKNQLQLDFTRRAENHSALVREIVLNFESALFGLRNVFVGSSYVSPAEFTAAAREILKRYDSITALQWVPIVKGSQRTAIETATAQSTGRDFRFTTSTGDVSPEADEYLPILYIEPMAGNERALGYDLMHGPTIAELTRARDHGAMTVSRRIRLIQDTTSDQYSVILIWPVLGGDTGAEKTVGFVQAVIRISDMLDRPLRERGIEPLDILYLDGSAPDPASRMLYHDPADADAPTLGEDEFRDGLHHEETVPVGDRQWIVLYRPNPQWLAGATTLTPWWLLFGGLAITGLLVGLVHILGRRAEVIGEEVDRQTLELKESRRQLESLLQSLPGMAFRWGREPSSGILFMSDGAQELTGYTVAEFMAGRPNPREIIHPDDLPFVQQKTRAALTDKAYFDIEYRILHASGEIRWVLSRGRGVFAETGDLRFIEGLVVDITAQRKAEADKLTIERLLQEGQKLESLGVLAGGVAHDFNNLLTTILGNAGLVRLESGDNTAIKENVQQIELAARHAAALCRQMLAYAGKGQLTKEPVDLVAMTAKIEPLLVSSISNSHISLEVTHGEQLPEVFGDPTQLSQIVMNLVLNAAEAMGEKPGRIKLDIRLTRVDHVTISQCVAGRDLTASDYVTLEVADEGPGMTPMMLKRIFEPFFSTKFEGRGLGLAAVIGIVRGHHGALHVRSEPGKGTCFTLMLEPYRTDSRSPLPLETDRPIALVVDDDEPVRLVTAELLNSLGYYPVTAESGGGAIELFRQDPDRFAVAMIDCVMPELSGEETMVRLRTIRPSLPVLMMSGHTDRAHHLPREGSAAVDFITKPFGRAALDEKLRALGADCAPA